MILAAWWNCGSARSRWVWGRNLNLRRDLTFATVGLLVVGGFGKNSQEESELLLLVVGGFGKNSQEEPELLLLVVGGFGKNSQEEPGT